MQRVLVSLSFVLVLEPVRTVSAGILLLGFVKSSKLSAFRQCQWSSVRRPRCIAPSSSADVRRRRRKTQADDAGRFTYLSSSSVSNFLGFLGQHSQM